MGAMVLLSVPDAAARYELSRTQIRRLVANGTLKGQRVGSSWGINEASLKAYLAKERKRGPKPKKKSR